MNYFQQGVLCLLAILLCTSLAAQMNLTGNITDKDSCEPIQYLPSKAIKQVKIMNGIASHDKNENLIVRFAIRSNNYYTKGIRIYGDCKFITQSPTFILANFNSSFSAYALFLNFEIIGKGNVTFTLINNQNQIIYNRTMFMNEGKQEMKIDFMNADMPSNIYPLTLQYDNGLQEIKTILP